MTTKEKAEELFGMYKIIKWFDKDLMSVQTVYSEKERAKQCALIAVDEILKQYQELSPTHLVTAYKTVEDFNINVSHIKRQLDVHRLKNVLYFEEVKQEIEKL